MIRSKLSARIGQSTHRSAHGHKFVTNEKPSVDLGSTPVHDFGDVDAIIAGYVLVSDTAGDAEA